MNRLKLACVLVGALLALTGCGSGDDEVSPPTTTETTTTETTTTETTTTETTTTTDAETSPAQPPAETIRIVVENGVPKGGIVRRSVDRGDRVVLVVASDVADEVHVHGYDVSRDVAAGGTARIRFRADVPGRFEVELEERHVAIGVLTVEP